MSDAFVERSIECTTDAGIASGFIRLFQPIEDAGAWRCNYALRWAGFEKEFYAMGVDAFQALQLAVAIVPVHIETSQHFREGRLSWGGEILNQFSLRKLFEVKWMGSQA